MNKIKLLLALILLLGLFNPSLLLADTLSSDKDILGSWLLEYTKKTPTDTETKPMGMTWLFKDSQLTQKNIPQVRGNPYDAPAVDYIIEGGNIKVSVLGRTGKYDVYSLVEKTDSTIVLKDNKYGSYMYFSKK